MSVVEYHDEESKNDILNESDVREQITEGSFGGIMQDENISLRQNQLSRSAVVGTESVSPEVREETAEQVQSSRNTFSTDLERVQS